MPRRKLHLHVTNGAVLRAAFVRARAEAGVAEAFPSEVLAAADQAAARRAAPTMPDADLTDVPFATLDPPGSRDLDQAYAIERAGSGYRVRYAIADVAAFVRPGDPVDVDAHRRAETVYAPDVRVPLHPPVLSEGAASLLPGERRPALVWTFDLDADGRPTSTHVGRAVVRSREQQDYPTVQAQLDAGSAPEGVSLMREVGLLRQALERERGGMSLNAPDQEVVADGAGGWTLALRASLPVEGWNAQLSLMTGMAAASLMLAAGVGVLRTMPPADPRDVERLRRIARGLGIDWPAGSGYGQLLATLDPSQGRDCAFITEATSLFRGAAYTSFEGTPPEQVEHAAIAAPYTHCTAPLRRLVDRYAGEVAVALCAGADVPAWVLEALPALPAEMAQAVQRGNRLERADVDLVEAAMLSGREGEVFPAVVVDLDEHRGGGTVQLRSPAVLARCDASHGPLPLGDDVRVRLVEADVETSTVRFVDLAKAEA